ncbi:N-acetyltransferase [Alteribacter lacisalsi]|uniref:N-acetyltransferase n=1 Tax=Alteribacter lacisalsi TaxID=2045244 RepID=A0A2W0HXJ7_9BACI|nr:GNAT family N-acetyltransferase [Alteribacter lacisalsi]PYZ98488.1 N-acetyltransferase [Alteribacter lacisalsi]
MIIPYHQDCEKIAMGLLSYMPGEKKVKKLQNTMKHYREDPDWQLFFWKEEDTIVGVMGIERDGNRAYLHHLAINPSYRAEGIGRKMVLALGSELKETLCATKSTTAFIESCYEGSET